MNNVLIMMVTTIIATNGLVKLIRLSINRARWNRIYAMLNKMCLKVDNMNFDIL